MSNLSFSQKLRYGGEAAAFRAFMGFFRLLGLDGASAVGGFIGVLCGVIVAKVITLVIGFPTSVQLWSVLLGLFMATATGIFFGVYPASKAAKLDPVVALRAEL